MLVLAPYLIAASLTSGVASYCDLAVREEVVLVRQPSMRVFGAQGKELTPRIQPSGEFSNLKLRVSYIREGTAWVPESTADAAFALREMLPSEYYNRLIAGYSREWHRLMMSDDAAINERVGDVARYLKRIWGTDWSGKRDEFEMLADIVDYSTAPHITLPQSCDRRKGGGGN